MTIKLTLVPKSTPAQPAPWGLLALLYALPASASSSFQIDFAHAGLGDVTATLDADGEVTSGVDNIYKKLGTLFAAEGISGKDQDESKQILALLALIPPPPAAFPTTTHFLSQLEQRLTLRTFLVGHTVSLADWAIWGAIKGNSIASVQISRTPHTARWYAHLSAQTASIKAIEEILAQQKIKPAKVVKEKGEEQKANATFELGLPNAKKGEVVTRFPPEPSGYLHIGHAKAAILNQYFAKHYEGRFLIRFDDTNPSKEKAEFEESIIEDLALLGVRSEKRTYTSDYFDQLHILCVQMIKQGDAYADDTPQETMRAQRMDGIPSARRETSPEESLARFAEMAEGSEEGQKWCIRAKMSVDNPNKAMRDPVVYRVNILPHHRTGTKFKIYPTYDFACPIVDSIEGVTRALRTNEYRDRNPQYQWMLDTLKLRKVEIWDFGRMSFVYTLLSKRKLKDFVEKGAVRGWDDPRFPTVRGIRRRGMTIEGLNNYMLLQGPSQATTNLDWDGIWATNKKVIDPVAPRFVALEKEGLVKVTVSGPETPEKDETREVPKHKKNPEAGLKKTVYSNVIYVEQEDAKSFAENEEITLMDWGNAFVRKIVGSPITSIEMELHLEGDFKKTKKKITWLGSSPTIPFTPVLLLDYDYLTTKAKLEEGDDVYDYLNPVTEFKVEGVADHNVESLKKGEIIQFERKGYYIVDKPYGVDSSIEGGEKDKVELILIPDGKAANIALKYVAPVKEKGTKKEVGGKGVGGAAVKETKKIPEPAPKEAVETVLLSDGKKGFEQPIKTKMFRVPSIHGEDGVEPFVSTKMFDVKPVYSSAP